MEQIAIIDLGTNTFHLLIAEVEGSVSKSIYSEKLAVKIGMGGINQGFIAQDACERALRAMIHFKKEANKRGIEKIVATATSAFRNAKNGIDLANKIKEETGISINIISGDKEAELIYLGVCQALTIGEKPALIVDIGGGSVEFIIGNDQKIFWKQSFEIGGQRLIELFQKTDPIQEIEINALLDYLSKSLTPLKEALTLFQTQTLIGSSGSFDTFSEMVIRKNGYNYSIESTKEYEITIPDFYQLYNTIISNNRAKRMELPGMIELRVDMIVVATILVKFLLEELKLTRMRVSTYALKEGVLKSILAEINKTK